MEGLFFGHQLLLPDFFFHFLEFQFFLYGPEFSLLFLGELFTFQLQLFVHLFQVADLLILLIFHEELGVFFILLLFGSGQFLLLLEFSQFGFDKSDLFIGLFLMKDFQFPGDGRQFFFFFFRKVGFPSGQLLVAFLQFLYGFFFVFLIFYIGCGRRFPFGRGEQFAGRGDPRDQEDRENRHHNKTHHPIDKS